MEKAFAKYHGNYEHIIGGWMAYGVTALNGGPWTDYWNSDVDVETIWSDIKTHDDDWDIVTAGSQFCGSDSETNPNGVACGHAYTILHTYTLSGGDNDGQRLLKIRNPWGSEKYSSNWSDSDDRWTDEYRT